ncbi:MAG TPA: adenylate/guanylate cyclase domain-containing protein [Methylomirabilota bacterium]|nr:adenylate/guanylate cyclase domain-containing protein [Methylomirabilota bacterium]
MKFSEVVEQARALLQRKGRITYRALQREFALDDQALEDLKDELIDAEQVARDENGKVLVWASAASVPSSKFPVPSSTPPPSTSPQFSDVTRTTHHVSQAAGERRQLTVMFCDLVGSTALSTQLDPEDLREVVRQYQQTCAAVIQRHEGHIAQYLGDGLLVYFGYPSAHEDDARRAVRAGLEIVGAIHGLPLQNPLQVRIGIHTGLVVVGDIGAGGRTEQLALGETPNIAARIQGLAEPNTVLISAATQRLVDGQFECQPFGSRVLKGIETPISVYHVQSEQQHLSPLAGKTTLAPLVGREQEVGLLVDRWEQAEEGRGHVVLLSGEPGIGKSRLAYTVREHIRAEGSLLFEARCSPYYQHSALYPLIDMLQRLLLLNRQEPEDEKAQKVEQALALYGMQETLPLFTALLSLPTPPQYPPLQLTPQKQKERTFQALLQLFIAQAERQATVSVWEDLHWADPSSLEFLSLLIEQIPTTKLLLVLTFRPEFTPPWKPRSHISQLVLNRLGKRQVELMIEKVAAGKGLSAEIIEQIRIKTDGVPLFVEELTKSVVENVGAHGRASLQTIPATLQEALLARLDRLSDARQVAQLGATLGREFSYELLHAVAPLNEADLQAALTKLVDAEILYQRGVGEQTRYFFKHALIQDTAYQSLLKSTRQQYHQRIAQVLDERFLEAKETQPELLAYHYTEAGLIEQAIPYWQRAGQRAMEHSANAEATRHLSKGLSLLQDLPDTPGNLYQELVLQITLGASLMATKGYAAPEVEQAYTRARELCQQLKDTSRLFPVLIGLLRFYSSRAEHKAARELGEQLLSIAQHLADRPIRLVGAYQALGATLLYMGEFTTACAHLERGVALYDARQHRRQTLRSGQDVGVVCLGHLAWVLWSLGYPDQALQKLCETLQLAQEVAHPLSLCWAHCLASIVHQFRSERQKIQEHTEAALKLSSEHGFAQLLAQATLWKGWLQIDQGRKEEGRAQIQGGLAAHRATGAEVYRPYYLALLAEAYGHGGQIEEGFTTMVEALDFVDRSEERFYEAELYRLKGELTLQQFNVQGSKFTVTDPRPLIPDPQSEAEACFLKAIVIAQKQQAKSWELRAATSLARLWQSQGKRTEAHELLSHVYNWFTEGFDTKDLQEARALLGELT